MFIKRWAIIKLMLVPVLIIAIVVDSPCQSGHSLDFNGTNGHISFNGILDNLQLPFTVDFWVKVDRNGSAFNSVMSSHYSKSGFYSGFWVTADYSRVSLNFGDGRGALHPAYRRGVSYLFSEDITGRWIHVAFVVRGQRDMQIYINGQEVSGSYSGSGLSQMSTLINSETEIGLITNNSGDNYFKGSLDELRVWSFPKTAEGVRNDMCRKLEGNEDGLVAYWRFDQGSGNVVSLDNLDLSGELMGDVNWQISGAAIGDNSSYSYSLGSPDTIDIAYGSSFISVSSQERDKLIGYQFYQVSSAPNSSTGASVSFDNGYVGLFPIYTEAKPVQTNITLNSLCSKGDYRYGNDDLNWEPILIESEFPSFSTNHFSEMVLGLSSENLDTLFDQSLCADESLLIDIESPCVDEYLWSTGSNSSSEIISDAGYYWVERTINGQPRRDTFQIVEAERVEDFFVSEIIEVCPSDFPVFLPINLEADFDDVRASSSGMTNGTVTTAGYYWVDFFDNCETRRDSVLVIESNISTVQLLNIDSLTLCATDFPFGLNYNDDLVGKVNIIQTSPGIKNGVVVKPGLQWVEYEYDCTYAIDTLQVNINKVNVERIPNVFTPNNDGHNDYFEIDEQLLGSTVSIFNRVGRKIVELENYQNNWNGNGLEAGTYYYSIYEHCSATLFKGWVSIFR